MPLLTTKESPPGGWIYIQKDAAGKDFKKLRTHGTYSGFVREILTLRQANNLPGADEATVDTDLQAYTCFRLGNDPRYCVSGTGPVQRAPDVFYGQGPQGCGVCGGAKAT